MTHFFLTRLACGAFLALSVAGCAYACRKPVVMPGPVVRGFTPVPAPGPAYPVLPQAPPYQPPPPSAPSPAAPDVRLYPPDWRAVPDAGRNTAEPPLAKPEADRPGVRLLPPSNEPGRPAAAPTPALPVGIPEFAAATERVASGLKPLLDGLDWLRDNGYRTVLHVRAPGQDDGADRREVEKRGLKYVSLEVSATTLARTTLDEFSRTVGDAALQPLFVYDKDGRLAGALWYLHFRIADRAGDELARAKASRLGLREDGDPERRTLWVAVQKLLSELVP